MNTYTKTILALGIALITIPHICGALDAKGDTIKTQLNNAYNSVVIGGFNVNAFGAKWTPLLNGAVKTYIEDNSKVLLVKDSTIMRLLQAALNLNNSISKIIENIGTASAKTNNTARQDALKLAEAQKGTATRGINTIRDELEPIQYQGITGRSNAKEMLLMVLSHMTNILNAAWSNAQ
jgi:uncharacterized protein YdcH (DUF465 family)